MRRHRPFRPALAALSRACCAAAATLVALPLALSAHGPARAQTGELTDPEVFVGLFLEACVWTAPDFRGAAGVLEREGLTRSTVIFDRDLYTGPLNVVSAVIEERDGARVCRMVGLGVDEAAATVALSTKLEDDFGVLLIEQQDAQGALLFTAPIAGVDASIRVEPAEASEEPRTMLIAIMPIGTPG